MDESVIPYPHPPRPDRSLASFVVGMLVVASVPVALWMLSNPYVALLVIGLGVLALSHSGRRVLGVATRRLRR